MRIFSLVALFSLLVNFASCQSTNGGKSDRVINTISIVEFEKTLSATPTAQLIDVRTAGEFQEGHLKNSINIDIHSDEFMDRVSKLDKTKPVMVYCRSGGRSSAAAKELKDAGFTKIYNMDGGITAWGAEGKPVE